MGPHRQCGGLLFQRSRDPIPLAALLIFDVQLDVQLALMGYCPGKGGGNRHSAIQLDLLSLTPVHRWLWSTETGSCLGYFSTIYYIESLYFQKLWRTLRITSSYIEFIGNFPIHNGI